MGRAMTGRLPDRLFYLWSRIAWSIWRRVDVHMDILERERIRRYKAWKASTRLSVAREKEEE